jgi:hypothetical protein
MTKRLFSIGLMSVVAVAGFCSTGEACHHRRARNAGRHGGGDVQQVNSGCCSNAGYVHSSGPYYGTTSYGANDYGHQGVYGNQGMHGGQGYVDGNVGGNVISNRVILGR